MDGSLPAGDVGGILAGAPAPDEQDFLEDRRMAQNQRYVKKWLVAS